MKRSFAQKGRTLTFCTLISGALVGCVTPHTVRGGKDISLRLGDEPRKLITKFGYRSKYAVDITRSTSGDRLFIQFADDAHNYKVAIVSSNNVRVKDLPGQSCLNDEGKAVFWVNPQLRTIHFATGYTLPTNAHTWHFMSDGRFAAFFDTNHLWIARVESPMEEIVVIPQDLSVRDVFSHTNRLHVFVQGEPEGKTANGIWAILKHFEYEIEGNQARLLRVQKFDFTRHVSDYDPESNLMLAPSQADMFGHGWLVDLTTGRRKRVSGLCELFLQEGVVRRVREELKRR